MPSIPVYRDARAALTAISREAAARQDAWIFEGDPAGHPDPVDWQSAAAVIVGDGDGLSLNARRFWLLNAALDAAPDRGAAEAIRQVLQAWADAHWPEIKAGAVAAALKCFEDWYLHDFRAVVRRWRQLGGDRELLESALNVMERGAVKPDFAVARLRHLSGDDTAAERVLAVVASTSLGPDARDEFASLLAEWLSDSSRRQLLHLLWRSGTAPAESQTILDGLPAPILRAADLLREFGLSITPDPPHVLADMSAESRLSWREDLARAVEDDVVLRDAVTEALFRFAPVRNDRAAIFAVLQLHRPDALGALVRFHAHPDTLVRRRVAAVAALAAGALDVADLFGTGRARVRPVLPVGSGVDGPGARRPVRTWIGDARIERLIEDGLNAAAHAFGDEVWLTRASGEETHVAILFERLRHAFASISGRLEMLATETEANCRLEITLEHRIVGKFEEGGQGVGANRFSTDVCVLFVAREDGQEFARRASLLQGKRIYGKQRPHETALYFVDVQQLRDLVAQTTASFLFLLGPTCDHVAMPVIPAQLFLDMVERGESATQIRPANASRLGKPIGTWLLEDVIGLWTGDWKEAIVRKAEGGDGRKPYLLVEIIADRVRSAPDGRAPASPGG